MALTNNVLNSWLQHYEIVPQQLEKVKQVKSAVSAFNTNIDAVIKISGETIEKLIKSSKFSLEDMRESYNEIRNTKDVLRGLIKCFSQGIAEEWLITDKKIYDWLDKNIGYQRLQMGGQGGIIGNLLAVLGVQKVMVHTGAHPLLQAEQFHNVSNLLGLDDLGNEKPAAQIIREDDEPQIHWIIEFAKNDSFMLENERIICPKSNRFIATYDKVNMNLHIQPQFLQYMKNIPYEYLLLSGFHNLSAEHNGIELLNKAAQDIIFWKQKNPTGIIHLELASTQDKTIREHILQTIAPLADSLGLNEREALDTLEILDKDKFLQISHQELSAPVLLEIMQIIKEKIKTPRIQLHMFGLYITLQNTNFKISAKENMRGMMLAATVAATKAYTGKCDNYTDLLQALQNRAGNIYLGELNKLADYLQDVDFLYSGITQYGDNSLIAVPTILIENPLTLVGMGDTISATSLVGAR